jgi:predicted phage tail protein
MVKQDLRTVTGAGGGGGCFRAGAQVQLEGGKTIAIELLKVGDTVLAFDDRGEVHAAKVTKVHYHPEPQPILRVKFWKGEIHITPNHWVLNQYDSFAEIGRLTAHDALVDGMGHLRPIESAELIGHEPVWNLTVEPHHTFICDGVRVHNGGHRESYPVVTGAGGGGGGKSNGRAPIEDPDTLESRAMISVLDLIGEGEIGGLVDGAKSIFFTETPVQNPDGSFNFKGVSWSIRNGTQNQQTIPGYAAVEAPYSVGIRVRADTPRTVTVNNPNVDRVRVVVTLPSLAQSDADDGDTHGSTVQFRFMVSVDSGPYVNLIGDQTISGKARSRYQRAYMITLPKPGSTWNIRMERITADSETSLIADETYFDSYVEIIDARLSYPNSALIGVTLDSAQFSSVPPRAYLVDGLYIRVPNNYDPVTRTYTGIWNGGFKLAISSCPPWILYDLLTNYRYGLGQFISPSQIDTAALYKIGRYCDEMVPDGFGGMESRFTVNTVINSQAEAYKLIMDLSSAFRGMSYWNGGMVAFSQDAPTEPGMIFTPANVIGGTFNYTGTARRDRHSVALITWNDPKENYKQKIEYVEDGDLVRKYGIRKIEMVAFGCTSRGQANRVGKWILYTEQFESDLVSFSVGLDSALMLPGEVIKIHDTYRAGKRMGGRLAACTDASATLDAEVELDSVGAQISIRLPDGTFADRIINEVAGAHTVITWNNPLPAVPVANAIWLLAEPKLEPMLARVIGIGQGEEPGTFSIAALEHNPSKFNVIELGWELEEPNTSIIDPSVVSLPINMAVTESQYQVAPGIVGTKLYVSWEGREPSYELRWRRIGKYQTNWQTISTSTATVELENVRAGIHEFELIAINGLGRSSDKVVQSHDVVGRTTAPGDVYNFVVTRRTSDLLLKWDEVKDIAVSSYEVRVGPSWDTAEVITAGFRGTMVTHDQNEAGTYYYHVRSVSVLGVYSDNVTTFELVLHRPEPVAQFDCVQNSSRVEFRWNVGQENNIVGYELREGKTWSSATFITRINASTYSMSANSIAGTRTFWIKAIASPGIYGGVARFATTEVAIPEDRNVVFTDDEKNYGWLGSRYQVSVIDTELQLDAGKSYGEYTWGVSLPQTFRARNSIDSRLDAVVLDTTSWATASYAWNETQATRRWAAAGDLASVDLDYYISRRIGLDPVYTEGFSLNATAYGEKGVVPTSTVGVTYGVGRFLKGVKLNDFTRLNWNMAVPSEFNTTFWAIPEDFSGNRVLWSGMTATGLLLILGFDNSIGSFYLEDTMGQKITLPFNVEIGDRLLVGIVQTVTTRKLLVGGLTKPAVEVIAAFTPIGALTSVRLHQ